MSRIIKRDRLFQSCEACGSDLPFCPLTGSPHASTESHAACQKEPNVCVPPGEESATLPTSTKGAAPKRARSGSKTARCAACNRSVGAATAAVVCHECSRVYHRNCFLADTGAAGVSASQVLLTNTVNDGSRCQVCLSGEVNVAQAVAALGAQRLLEALLSPSSDDPEVAAVQLLFNGFTTVPIAPADEDKNALVGLRDETERLYKALQRQYLVEVNTGSAPTLTTGYANFRMRGEGRFEIVDPLFRDRVGPLLSASPVPAVLRRVLREAKDEAPVQMSCGCFHALSGAVSQNWHTDGPSLRGSQQTLHPYAINVFVPLVPVTAQNGTEFLPGSHLAASTKEALLEAAAGTAECASLQKHFDGKLSPAVPLGHALLFDYRVHHHGLANRTPVDRPCVYVTHTQPWYRDAYNFGAGRYGKRLELPPSWAESRADRLARRHESK